MRNGLLRLLVAFLALGFIPVGAIAADPIEIPVILPMSGPGVFAGKELAAAMAGIEDYVNRTGGIRGRPLKFTYQDDQTNPQNDVQFVNALIAKGVPAILGPAVPAGCGAVVPLIAKSGPVAYCFSNAVETPVGGFMFSSFLSVDDEIRAMLRYFRGRGWDRIAFLGSTDKTGQDGERSLNDQLSLPENRALVVTNREHFGTTDLSVAAQLTRIKASNANVIMGWTTGTPLGTVLRGASDVGLDLPIITSPGNAVPAQLLQYQGFLPKALLILGIASLVPDRVTDRRLRAAIDAYTKAMTAIGEKPGLVKTLAWDPALWIVAAYRAIGPTATAEQIRAWLSSQNNLVGVNGKYDFRSIPQRGVGDSSMYIVRWDPAKQGWIGLSQAGGTP